MGKPAVFLGMEICRDRDKRMLFVNQPRYTIELLTKYNLLHCRDHRVPLSDYPTGCGQAARP
jgi:hypothetical protein